MSKARTIVECTTAEEAGRALDQGYTAICPKKSQSSAARATTRRAWTPSPWEEILIVPQWRVQFILL